MIKAKRAPARRKPYRSSCGLCVPCGDELDFYWLRGQDSNLRPTGYEPVELTYCSTARYIVSLTVGFHLYDISASSAHDAHEAETFRRHGLGKFLSAMGAKYEIAPVDYTLTGRYSGLDVHRVRNTVQI